jgi:hypothetical protein
MEASVKHATFLLVALLFAATLQSWPAQALNTRSFVSANGRDTNSCARTAPCRTLQAAHDKTNAGGEINMLDPAGYGPVTISKAISIVNDGVGSAGILVPSGANGINISAGFNDAINLRGLIIEGAGVGQNGIRFTSGKSLTIENCVIRNLLNDGITFRATSSSDPVSSNLAVSNTFVADNAGAGILVWPNGSVSVTAFFNRVETHYNGTSGISVDASQILGGGFDGYVVDSIANHNGTGFLLTSFGSLSVLRSAATGNGTGVGVSGTHLWLAQSMVTANYTGLSATNGGAVYSFGDNYFINNAFDGTAPTLVAKQ